MTIALHLTPELEQRLTEEAKRRGVPVDAFALQLLDKHLPGDEGGADLAELIQSWIEEEDDGEQADTGQTLTGALNRERLSDRKLFPPELKDVSW